METPAPIKLTQPLQLFYDPAGFVYSLDVPFPQLCKLSPKRLCGSLL